MLDVPLADVILEQTFVLLDVIAGKEGSAKQHGKGFCRA